MPDDLSNNLVIMAGMPRAGTTSLYHILAQHPALYAPYRKEVAYFSYNYYKGEAWYRDLYRERGSEQRGLDVSPQYFMDHRSLPRITRFAERAKVILAVRDPVKWIISLFRQVNKFEQKESFADFVDGFTITGAREVLECRFADGYVTDTIERFRDVFGEDVLLYDFAYFTRHPLAVLNAIEAFLGIEPYFNAATFDPVAVNAHNQRNIRWVTWLLSRESTIETLAAVFPRSVLQWGRMAYDRLTRVKGAARSSSPDPRLAEIAQARFGEDRAFVEALFADKPVQTGRGSLIEVARR